MKQHDRLDEAPPAASRRKSENLPLLYQGLLTGIVRLQSRRQQIPDGETFRRRTKTALQEIERDGVAAGYDLQDIKDTHFAVVAFLDSVILNSSGPSRADWERKTLQEDLFGNTDAGVVFFEKLEGFRSRRDSEHLADILEIYLVCLLLGFEGRYSGGLRAELEIIAEKTRRRIDDIRGRSVDLSPDAALPVETPAASPGVRVTRNKLRLIAIAAVALVLICFLLLKWNLILTTEQVRTALT